LAITVMPSAEVSLVSTSEPEAPLPSWSTAE